LSTKAVELALELGGGLPLFTQLPRRVVFPEIQLPALRASRKLIAVEKQLIREGGYRTSE
jgi:hypothetical protein